MKRLVLVLLMFLLPVQIAWAAAGPYCAHEQAAGSWHFGHHFHAHQPQSDDGSSQPPLKLHPDCSSCYTGAVGILEVGIPIVDHLQASLVCPQPVLRLPAPPAEPERPKWLLAV